MQLIGNLWTDFVESLVISDSMSSKCSMIILVINCLNWQKEKKKRKKKREYLEELLVLFNGSFTKYSAKTYLE